MLVFVLMVAHYCKVAFTCLSMVDLSPKTCDCRFLSFKKSYGVPQPTSKVNSL